MANTFYLANDAEFAIWLANFIAKAGVYQSELSIAPTEVEALQTDLEKFSLELNLKRQKKEESSAQTKLVEAERKKLNASLGLLNTRFKSLGTLPPNVIEELGLRVDDFVMTKRKPSAPTDLVVTGTSDGVNLLKWNRAGNRHGTLFVIEVKTGGSDVWVMVSAVTNSRFRHENQTPGVRAEYRIKAKRGETESVYSNRATVYG